MSKAFSVLHIDSEYGWRGGQQQVVYLFERMHRRGEKTLLVCQPDSDLHRYCKTHSLPHCAIRMRGEVDIVAGWKLSKLCRKEGFSIIHCHAAHAHAIGLWIKFFHRSPALVVTRRVDFSIKRSMMSRIKYMTSMVDQIVCVSNRIRNVLVTDGVPKEKLMTIYSGVDIGKHSSTVPPPRFRESIGIPEGDTVIGTVAALVDHKDYPNLLKAAQIVLRKKANVTFCAVGDGELQEELFSLSEKLGLKERFLWMGYRSDVGNFLKIFDVFVLASHLEGLGTSILDAMAQGIPVVATDAGGISEMVTDRSNGRLVPKRHPGELAEAILDMVDNPSLMKTYADQAKREVVRFSVENTVDQYLSLYNRFA